MTTTYDIFLTIGLLVTMVTVYLLYGRQLQIIRKLRSLVPTIAPEPYAPKERRFSENLNEIREMRKMPELEGKLREADARIEASMDRIREIRGETCEILNSLQEKETPSPTRQQALTALHAIASGANDIREQYRDIETIRDALNRLPADA
jgi:hypothetical protein